MWNAVSSRIWTRVNVSISYDDNHFTTGTYKICYRLYIFTLESNEIKIMCSKEYSEQYLISSGGNTLQTTSITKTIQVRWTRHAGYWWRSKDELISDILLWIPSHGQESAGQPAKPICNIMAEGFHFIYLAFRFT